MKKNLGSADRIIRILIGVVVAVLYYMGIISGTLGIVLLAVGAVLVVTSFINFCPLYRIFGMSTCPNPNKV